MIQENLLWFEGERHRDEGEEIRKGAGTGRHPPYG